MQVNRLRCCVATLVALIMIIVAACNQTPAGRSSEPRIVREDQEEFARLRKFVELLHQKIDQLHKDKQRLREEVERLQQENAALRAEMETR